MPLCELCCREVIDVSRHHLTPKQKGGKHMPTVNLCQPCHTTLHHTFSNAELARIYNSVEKLLAAAPLQNYLSWIKTKSLERIPVKKRKK
ncbi:MAG: HNH endonuclease [Sphingobacteriales bacterium]|nr:MAG: HNH endonuclease [Sphingobacteriales bacterium]